MKSEEISQLEMVEIEINHHCNRACSYCPNSVAERIEQGEMDPLIFEQLMKQLVDMNYQGSVSYQFYNEPMLAKNLEWFIKTTRQYLPSNRIDFYSNGTLLTSDKFKSLVQLGVSRFLITKHEGVKNYIFEKVFNELSEDEKKNVVFKSFKDLKFTNRGGAINAGPQEPAHLVPCYIPKFLITVTVLGNVLPCFEDFHEESIMGNITKTHLKEIWSNDKFVKMRHDLGMGLRHKHSPCNKCNRMQVCIFNE